LTDDPYVDASEIEVQVQNGEVSLNGSVENRNQRHRAELIAEQVSGVIHLQNNLRVLHQHAQHQQGQSTDEHNKDKAGAAARPAQK
jgi:HSP20 family molecular chaperone IbpA